MTVNGQTLGRDTPDLSKSGDGTRFECDMPAIGRRMYTVWAKDNCGYY